LAFAARANNDDLPNYYQAMNGPRIHGILFWFQRFQREPTS
jgi:hypothetical protein